MFCTRRFTYIAFAHSYSMVGNRTNAQLLCALDELMETEHDRAFAKWTTEYLRNVTPSRGVRIPKLRKVVANWYNQNRLSTYSGARQRNIAYELIRKEYFEDKLAGTLVLQEHVIPAGNLTLEHLPELKILYEEYCINDWSTCDWFCIRVLSKLATEQDGVSKLLQWSNATSIWSIRSSLVSMIPEIAAKPQYYDDILETASVVIARDERFAKTAVGWLLREICRTDKHVVRKFLNDELRHFSKEALDKVTKAFSDTERKKWRNKLKQAQV